MGIYLVKKSIHLIFTFWFLCSHAAKCHIDDPLSPLADVKIILKINRAHQLHLDFKRVHHVLANQNLPVWITEIPAGSGKNEIANEHLKLKHKVMKHVGPFTFYQDSKMNAAAVYFHQRQEFDGFIDTRYLIRRLSINKIHPRAKTIIQLGESAIIPRPQSLDHPPNEVPTSNQDEINDGEHKIRRTYRNHEYDGYLEILVIVSCEMMRELQKNPVSSDKYVNVVSYVLTLFNGVDMLYSKLEDTNIKLNIAGIIILTTCDTTTFISDCYSQPFSNSQYYVTMLSESCAEEKIKHFVLKDREKLPLESYDMIFFLSTYHLFAKKDERIYRLEGSSFYVPVYEYKKLNYASTPIALAREDGTFRNYITVAHELAHLMNVRHDDGLAIQEGICCGHIMKLDGTYWCAGCSSWSAKSKDAIFSFFSSADACGFTNYPRSLYPKGRREMLTADHQCRCYGYKSAKTSEEIGVGYCGHFLQCLDENDEVHETLRPLDGTPCGIGRVCWETVCRSIKHGKPGKLSQQLEQSSSSHWKMQKRPLDLDI